VTRTPSVLVVSSFFPPDAAVGGQRVAGLCRYLADRGWRVTVVTMRLGAEARIDPELAAVVPSSIKVLRSAAPDIPALAARVLRILRRGPRKPARAERSWSSDSSSGASRPERGVLRHVVDWASWWLHIPDGLSGWLAPATYEGLREAMRRRPDVVFSSAPAWTGHLVGACLSRVLGVPLVVDFRDPWCGSAFHSIPYAAHRRLNAALEREVVRRACRITCAWDGIRRHLQARYPRRSEDLCTILNGYDAEEMDAVEPVRLDRNRCVFLHVGTFYGPRSPQPLLSALGHLKDVAPQVAARSYVVFAGAPSYNGLDLKDLCCSYNVGENVRLCPPLPHRDALALLKGADVALLFGQSGSEALASIPAKAYEYVGAGKPVLTIGAGAEVCKVIRQGGCQVVQAHSGSSEDVAEALGRMLWAWQSGALSQGDVKRRAGFTRARMAAALSEQLWGAIGFKRCGSMVPPARSEGAQRWR